VGVSVSGSGLSLGHTLDFFLSPMRDAKAAKAFLLKTLTASHTSSPRVIGRWTKMSPTPKRSTNSKEKDTSGKHVNYARVKYLNNLIEQDQRAH